MLHKQSTVHMTHDDWTEARSHSIGGSDAAAIVGLNPYVSAYSLWAEKTGKRPVFEGNLATRVGTYLEGFVAKLFEEQTGKKVRRENAIIRSDDYPFAHANIDRVVVGENAGLEIKTTSALNTRMFRGQEFPARYYAQCVHYLAVTGKQRWYLAVLIGNSDFRIYTLDRDEGEIKALMDAERDFWRLVRYDIAPEADGMDCTTETIADLYPSSTDGVCDLSGYRNLLLQRTQYDKSIKDLQSSRQEIDNQIKAFMEDCGRGVCDGYTVSWHSSTRRIFDTTAFVKDHANIDLSPYYKVTATRTFRVTTKGD